LIKGYVASHPEAEAVGEAEVEKGEVGEERRSGQQAVRERERERHDWKENVVHINTSNSCSLAWWYYSTSSLCPQQSLL
jgi:hypothetical protein